MSKPLVAFTIVATAASLAQAQPVDPAIPGDTTDPTLPDPITPVDPAMPTTRCPEPAPARTPTSDPPSEASTTVVRAERRRPSYGSLANLGVSVSAGAGVSGFTNDTLRGSTNDGGAWGVRVGIGTRRLIGFEASYLGSAQTIDALGVDDNARLVSNGAQGNLRLNFLPGLVVSPFVFGGGAIRRYDLTNTTTNTSALSDTDTVFEIPMGIGFGARWGGLLVEARGEYRASFDEELAGDAPMNRYGASLDVGYEF